MLYLAIIATVFTSVIATDYCKLQSCTQRGYNHTMCMYPSSTLGQACVKPTDRGLNNDEKMRIVRKHNELRQKVASGQEIRGSPGPQPAAVYMSNLTWDNELEMIAQRWVDQCIFGHDQCRNVEKDAVGQNAAITMNSVENKTPVEDMIQMWYDEVNKLDNKQVDKFTNPPGVGHYTQLLWAKTIKIGCGRMKYKGSGWNNQLLICNYSPAGNWIGQRIYQRK